MNSLHVIAGYDVSHVSVGWHLSILQNYLFDHCYMSSYDICSKHEKGDEKINKTDKKKGIETA